MLLILLCSVHTLKQGHGYAAGGTKKPQGNSAGRITHIDTLMPEYQTDHAEMYLCTSVLLPDEPLKLVGVEPLSKEEVVHHMLLFGEGQDPTYAPYIVSAFFPQAGTALCTMPAGDAA